MSDSVPRGEHSVAAERLRSAVGSGSQEDADTGDSGESRRSGWASPGTLIRVAFLVLVIGFVGWFVYRNWSEVVAAWRQMSPWAVVGALLTAIAATWFGAPAWRAVLAGLGSPLTMAAAQRVFLLGQLGKYLPGGVWTVLAQAELAQRLRVPRLRSGTASLMTVLLSVVTAFGLGGVLLLFTGRQTLGHYGWAFLAVLPLLVLLHPDVLVWVGRLASKLTHRTVEIQRVSERSLGKASAWLLIGSGLSGVSTWFLAHSLSADGPPLLLVIGVQTFAVAVGLVVVFAPAGAGARELVMVVGLSSYLPTGSALLVVLVSRLITIVADFGWAAVVAIHRPPELVTTTAQTARGGEAGAR